MNDISCTQPHFDLLSGIHGMKEESNIKWTSRHIKGHQDNDEYADLDKWALLNIECDIRAKQFWTDTVKKQRRSTYKLSKGMYNIKLCGVQIGTKLLPCLRKGISERDTFDYWVNHKGRIKDKEIQNIDWATHGKAMKMCSFNKQKWVAKFMSGWFASGKMMKVWNKRIVSSCPRCNYPSEDANRILLCKAKGVVEEWKTSSDKVKTWLDNNDSCPDLAILINNAIQAFKTGEPITLHEDISFDDVKQVYKYQVKIGWRLFIDGCLSVEWGKAQQRYLTWKGSRRKGSRWVAGLINQLWNIQWDAWMHRNSVLYDTPIEEIMSGSIYLERALKKEWELGFDRLPKMVRDMIPKKVSSIMNIELKEKKSWLVSIRRARGKEGDNRIQDEFSAIGSNLRKWVGI